jgi:uncharacterized membrane protein HdeD (DUF308 family)
MSDHATLRRTTVPIQRLYAWRALAALVWAGLLGVALAVADSLSPDQSLPVPVAALLAVYPVIDLVATFVEGRTQRHDNRTASVPQLVNAAISAVAAVAIAVAASHGTDAVLRVFGVWAIVTGLIQLGLAVVRQRRGTTGQLPMILAGGISTLAGGAFAQTAGQDDPALVNLAGYAVLGAIFFLLSARRLAQRV